MLTFRLKKSAYLRQKEQERERAERECIAKIEYLKVFKVFFVFYILQEREKFSSPKVLSSSWCKQQRR